MKNNIGEKLLFIDTETGGIDCNKHSLLSVGLVVWGNDREIIDSTEVFIRHRNYIVTSTAQNINKFNMQEHEQLAVHPKKAIELILNFCKQHFSENLLIPLAGHNTQFDVNFLKVFLKKNGRSFDQIFSHRIIDTYTLLRSLYYSGKITNDISSSTQAFRYFDIKVNGRHSAKGDAIATAQLFSRLLELL
ncbi:3'-5' exonuclease DinG [Sporomusa carbonis]|uniref:3'-5' exonuclease n=1 Tax=Sporomusa carbonis TaxID=3076075 RepID=UPI003A6F7C5F